MGNQIQIDKKIKQWNKMDNDTNQKYFVDSFKFHDLFEEDTENGLYFNQHYIPEEILVYILSYVDTKDILNAALVSKRWCNMVKSYTLWSIKYKREFNKKPKKLPWFVYYALFSTTYFDTNLIKNGNGQEKFKHWKIVRNYGDKFQVEEPPNGADCLPENVPDFNGYNGCFATSYYECNKLQIISLKENYLMRYILNEFKPHIYASEWVAGRFDCGCTYQLWCRLFGPLLTCNNSNQWDIEEQILEASVQKRIEQWEGSPWTKVDLTITDYPKGVCHIVFQHEGRDTQFWKGHYGSKMAGGVVKILFDSINPQTLDKVN